MRFNSIQAIALLVATALTVTVPPALAAIPSCEQVRAHAKNYTLAQIRAIAKRARLTEEQWAQVKRCIGDKK